MPYFTLKKTIKLQGKKVREGERDKEQLQGEKKNNRKQFKDGELVMDREAWRADSWDHKESDTTERLNWN